MTHWKDLVHDDHSGPRRQPAPIHSPPPPHAVLAPPAPAELSQSLIDQAATIDTLGRYAFGWSDSDNAGRLRATRC